MCHCSAEQYMHGETICSPVVMAELTFMNRQCCSLSRHTLLYLYLL